MTNPNRYYGKAVVKADGKALEMESVSFTPSGVSRTDVKNGKGFYETEKGGSLAGTIFFKEGVSLAEINKMDDVTLVMEANTGQTFVAPHAWISEPTALPSGAGVQVKFGFAKSEEM